MDWTNNYGVRPLLPWSGRWFYGDLVFIADPYIWLVLGGIAFLLTSDTWAKIGGWAFLGVCVTAIIFLAARRRDADGGAVAFARTIWLVGVALLIALRVSRIHRGFGARLALLGLGALLLYWGVLAFAHRRANANAWAAAGTFAAPRQERVIRVAAMPMLATPFRWQAVAETDRAVYRFPIGVNGKSVSDSPARFAKPVGAVAETVARAEDDRRARIFLGFARFPIAQLQSDDCVGQALVQFADLRYTEPGASRGTFSVDIPVDCPAR